MRAFWASFLGNDPAPVIAYPDAVFLLDDSNDLFRFRRGASDDRGALVDPHLAQQFASNPSLVAKAGQLYYENGYTGAGELQGIAMLSNLFGQMGVKATIKPSRDITPDDLRQHNVILLGSPFQNVAVAQLIAMGDFNFKNPDSRHEQWRAQIVNNHPRANEASAYGTERDPSTEALKTDYSLITIQSGVIPGRYIAVLGGLDTTGTEGATLFATSRAGIEDLTRVLAGSGVSGAKGEMPLFQALIRVRLEKGYDVLGATLVAVHGLPPQNARATGGATPQDASSLRPGHTAVFEIRLSVTTPFRGHVLGSSEPGFPHKFPCNTPCNVCETSANIACNSRVSDSRIPPVTSQMPRDPTTVSSVLARCLR